ncbi:MAG: VanZ family protein [Gammaproteobacteria bacterium]|nr:VanZ family protein [Gammaproteobacteria bacterium]
MRLIWFVVILFIAYGSLYPFNFDFERALPTDLLAWLGNWQQRTIRSDLIANILLFIPYGFFGALLIQQDKRRYPILSVIWLILLGIGFALLLQFLQFYLPSRVPHAADALVNSVGILLGISMAAYTNSQRVRRLIPAKMQFQLTPALLVMGLWIGWAFFPYAPVFATKQIGLGIEGVYKSHWQWALWLKLSLFWLTFYFSFVRIMGRSYQLGILLAVSIFILAIKLSMFRSQLGWSELTAVPFALILHSYLSQRWQLSLMFAGALLLLVADFIWPLQWLDTGQINSVQWIPFKEFLGGSTWYHLSNLLEYSLILACLIFSLARLIKSYRWSALATLSLLVLLSALQLLLVNKTPDITNILMVLILGFLLERIDQMRS